MWNCGLGWYNSLVMDDVSNFQIRAKLRGYPLEFKTERDLFSYKVIDEGTKLLIDEIEIPEGGTCLDLGCGYGAIGVTMAKLNPRGKNYLVDKDFVATECARENCELNGVTNTEVVLSNGFSHINNIKFDLIASNLPTHVSKETRMQFFKDAKKQLNPGGKIYVVTVNKIKPYIERTFEEVFGNYTKGTHDKTYTVSWATG